MTNEGVDPSPESRVGGLAIVLGALVVAIATPLVIAGLAMAAVYNPVVLGFEQERTDVAALTGYPVSEVHRVTDAILSDLVLGPPDFDATVAGRPVLGPSEQAHMRDVRSVLLRFLALVSAGIIVLAVGLVMARRKGWFWHAVAAGAAALSALVIAVGALFVVAFDPAFLAFHEMFFPGGNFEFDPRTQRLVQLFPERFWSESIVGLAAVGLTVAVVVAILALRRAVSLEEEAATGGSALAAGADR